MVTTQRFKPPAVSEDEMYAELEREYEEEMRELDELSEQNMTQDHEGDHGK